jgi:hypothetical protein
MALVPAGRAKPWIQCRAKSVEKRPDGSGLGLYEVNVLGVPAGRRDEELVKCRPAPENETLGEFRSIEHLDQGAAE